MKTNQFARSLLKIRVTLFSLALFGMAGVGLSLGASLTVRLGQTATLPTGGTQAPNVSLADAMAAACH